MHAGHGQPYLCGDLNRFTFLLGGSGGERRRLMTSIPGRPGCMSAGQSSHGAANLVVDCQLASGLDRLGVCLLLFAAVVRVVESAPRAGSVPGISHGERPTSYGAVPRVQLRCRVASEE